MQAAPAMTGLESAAPGGALAQLMSWDKAANPSRPCRYWPCDLLSAFMLQMAGNGRCVNESMMLGSHDYAIEKLTQAQTLGDDKLKALAVRMFAYFDDEPCHAVAALVAESRPH